MPSNIVLAFDVYGTLLSTSSIASKLATHFGADKGEQLAITWRKYQLEYTWRMNSMGVYAPFDSVTRRSLEHTLAESGLRLNDEDTKEMMKQYDRLSTFPDVQPALEKLKDVKNLTIVAFSNGTRDMVSGSMKNSSDLSPYTDVFHDVVVVDECRKYKPAAEAYWHLAERMRKRRENAQEMSEIYLVSGNPFDIVGGKATGMNAIWVDRAGNGWQDRLLPATRTNLPSEIVKSLEDIVPIVEKICNQR